MVTIKITIERKAPASECKESDDRIKEEFEKDLFYELPEEHPMHDYTFTCHGNTISVEIYGKKAEIRYGN